MAPPDDTHKTTRLTDWMPDRFPYMVLHSSFALVTFPASTRLWILHTLYAYLDRFLILSLELTLRRIPYRSAHRREGAHCCPPGSADGECRVRWKSARLAMHAVLVGTRTLKLDRIELN